MLLKQQIEESLLEGHPSQLRFTEGRGTTLMASHILLSNQNLQINIKCK